MRVLNSAQFTPGRHNEHSGHVAGTHRFPDTGDDVNDQPTVWGSNSMDDTIASPDVKRSPDLMTRIYHRGSWETERWTDKSMREDPEGHTIRRMPPR